MDYYTKYLKYKTKYFQLKNLLGGDKPFIEDSVKINLFKDPEMEEFLNPIYGLIMCETGYISNNYFLNKSKLIKTDESNTIKKICTHIPETLNIKPTMDILNKLKPIDFGRFIAIKYVDMKKNIIENITKGGDIIFTDKINNKTDKETLVKYLNKLRNFFPFNTHHMNIYFYIILYCMWWTTDNYNGILQYYQGIDEVFTIINKYILVAEKQIYTIYPGIDNKFEQNILNMSKIEFNVFGYEWSNNFCNDLKYSDCGETTARNLINLLCYDGISFNITELKKYNPIPKLIEYYEIFNNFSKQTDIITLQKIYDKELNARDAWSYLIITYANHNVKFLKTCDTDKNINFELNAGLAIDKKTTNFFQLIKNLLIGITKWDDINKVENSLIQKITDITNHEGVGHIDIIHHKYNKFTIYCMESHYYMKFYKKPFEIHDISGINQEKIDFLNLLSDNKKTIFKFLNDESKYLWVNINPDDFIEEYLYGITNIIIKDKKLLELSLTDRYDKDLRRRIDIDIKDFKKYEYFKSLYNDVTKSKFNDYMYWSNNFDFVESLHLKHLNHLFEDRELEIINLEPLSELTSVGDNFMHYCTKIKSINVSYLSNLTTIGKNFMSDCTNLTSIDLSSLSNLTTIDDNFMLNCTNLTTIILPSNIKSIGDNFMSNCRKLKSIDLSALSNLTTIGKNFMSNCTNLKYLDLSSLLRLKSVGISFADKCDNLEEIVINKEVMSSFDTEFRIKFNSIVKLIYGKFVFSI